MKFNPEELITSLPDLQYDEPVLASCTSMTRYIYDEEVKQLISTEKPTIPELRKQCKPERKPPGRRKWARFLEILKKLGNRRTAAAGASIPLGEVTKRIKRDPEFADAVEEAEGIAMHAIEMEAMRRAVDGVVENVYNSRGEIVDTRLKYSDRLLIKLMEANDKERYGNAAPSVQVTVGVDQDVFKNKLAAMLGVASASTQTIEGEYETEEAEDAEAPDDSDES